MRHPRRKSGRVMRELTSYVYIFLPPDDAGSLLVFCVFVFYVLGSRNDIGHTC